MRAKILLKAESSKKMQVLLAPMVTYQREEGGAGGAGDAEV